MIGRGAAGEAGALEWPGMNLGLRPPARLSSALAHALMGAGLAGLLDALLRIPLDTAGFLREAVLVVVTGDLAVAAAVILALALLRRTPARRTAFAVGLAVAIGPLLSFKFHGALTWWVSASFCLVALPWLLRRVSSGPPPAAAVLAPAVLVGFALLPPSQRPVLPEAPLRAADAPASRPDILLVSCDTLRADAVDDPPGALPNLQALREEGSWAEYALSSSCSTRPGHVTMLTGLGAMEHAVASNENRVEVGAELVSQRLARAGYRTAAVVSNAVIQRSSGFGAGFEVYDDSPVARRGPREAFLRLVDEHTWVGRLGLGAFPPAVARFLFGDGSTVTDGDRGNGRHTTDHALALMKELQAGAAPYFLFVHYMDPHAPYWPPEDTAGEYAQGVVLPARYRGQGLANGDRVLMHRLGLELEQGRESAQADLDAQRLLYDEEVLFVDRMLGELRQQVAASGRPTLVLFTADHGEHFGEHGLVLHRNSLYEPLVRVPLMLAGPGVPRRKLAGVPHLEDVVPTLLAAAGVDRGGLAGRDLRAEVIPELPHFERYKDMLTLRDQGWKLHCELVAGADGVVGAEPRELYRLAEDPGELENLLHAEPEQAARLLAAVRAVLAVSRTSLDGAVDDDPLHQEALRALGYVDGSDDPETDEG